MERIQASERRVARKIAEIAPPPRNDQHRLRLAQWQPLSAIPHRKESNRAVGTLRKLRGTDCGRAQIGLSSQFSTQKRQTSWRTKWDSNSAVRSEKFCLRKLDRISRFNRQTGPLRKVPAHWGCHSTQFGSPLPHMLDSGAQAWRRLIAHSTGLPRRRKRSC
jgi:hypothetical protein